MKKTVLTFGLIALTSSYLVSCKCDTDTTSNHLAKTSDDVVEEVVVVNENGTLDENNNYVYSIGEISDVILPNNDTLNIGDLSTEKKLITQLNDQKFSVNADKTKDWITLDRVYFDVNKSVVTGISSTQIDNIARILKAYPTATLKIGGYTDITGDAAINNKISADRAAEVAKALVSKGIAADRMSTEGYGAQHFLCEANDTDLCKAQNRRVDIRITKK